MTAKRKKSNFQKKLRERNSKNLEYTQSFIPVKEIKNGIIETTDNRYIKILEIEPINFLLRSSEEQHHIISSFASWLKISPVRKHWPRPWRQGWKSGPMCCRPCKKM
jgi:hypothetical protein